MQLITRGAVLRILVLIGALAFAAGSAWWIIVRMPGTSYLNPLPPLTVQEARLAEALRHDVRSIAAFGYRNIVDHRNLQRTANWLEASLSKAGYQVTRQGYKVDNWRYDNIVAELKGSNRANEVIVIGAHYDTAEGPGVQGTVGANDNGSGVAALLGLARAFAGTRHSRTLQFVAFVNEELPSFQTESMGSLVYARAVQKRGDNVIAMLSLETLGYYADAENSQKYPKPFDLFYPSVGNFIAFVGNVSSRELVRTLVGSFRRHARFPSEGIAAPSDMPGIGWSDHWSFWQMGYPAVMVTDTAPFRYPYYHTPEDTPDKVDYDRIARIVSALRNVIAELARTTVE